jgi:hypothetical protein
MLNRTTRDGPEPYSSVATDEIGTMPPLAERTRSAPMSDRSSRADGSACATTRKVRPR